MELSIGCEIKPVKQQEQTFEFGIGDYVRRKSGRQNRGRVINIFQGSTYSSGGSFKGYKWFAKVRWENVYQRIGGGTSMVGPSIAVENLIKL